MLLMLWIEFVFIFLSSTLTPVNFPRHQNWKHDFVLCPQAGKVSYLCFFELQISTVFVFDELCV
jgi:hypothetical protein